MSSNMFESLMMEMMMNPNNAANSRGPPKLTCPLCKEEYVYKQGDTSLRLSERCSHEARIVFCKHSCSICLDDYDSGVALKCGHIFCQDDFKAIGGRMGKDSMKSLQVVTEEETEKRRREMQAEGGFQLPAGMPMELMAMMQAAMTREGQTLPLGLLQQMGQAFSATGPGFNDDDDDDDSDYHDGNDDDASTDSEMPPLLDPDVRGDVESDDDNSDADDDDDDMPDLLPRNGPSSARASTATNNSASRGAGGGSNANNAAPRPNNSTSAAGRQQQNNSNPAGTNRAATNRRVADDDSSSSDSVPPLLPRDDDLSSDTDDSVLEQSDEEPPALEQPVHEDSSSDDDQSELSVPPLDDRGSDTSFSDDSAAPPRRRPQRPTPARAGRGSANNRVPGRMPRNQRPVVVDPDSSGDESDDLPDLMSRGGYSDTERGGDGQQTRSNTTSSSGRPAPRTTRNNADRPPAGAARRPSSNAAPQDQRSYDEYLSATRDKAKKMKPGLLKKELRKMGVNVDGMLEKSELVEAYAKEMARRNANAVGGPVEAAQEAAPPVPPVPVDPLADLPSLTENIDPPEDGAWVRTPRSTSVDELQYVFLHNGELRAETIKVLENGYSFSVASNYDGYAFLDAHSSKNDGVHEVHQVHCTNVDNKIYDITLPTDATVELMPCGTGSLYMMYPEDPSQVESSWKLLYRSTRSSATQTLLSPLPHSTRMHTCSNGSVWLDVGHGGSARPSALKPGLWQVSRRETKHVLTSDELPEENRFITVDAARDGLWILRPSKGKESSTSVLLHIDRDGNKREQTIDVAFTGVQAMVNGGVQRDGVFLHYRTSDRWKLGISFIGKSIVEEYCDCARNSQIVSCGWGGVWVWKRAGRQRTQALSYVDQERKIHEYPKSFHPNSELVGLHDHNG